MQISPWLLIINTTFSSVSFYIRSFCWKLKKKLKMKKKTPNKLSIIRAVISRMTKRDAHLEAFVYQYASKNDINMKYFDELCDFECYNGMNPMKTSNDQRITQYLINELKFIFIEMIQLISIERKVTISFNLKSNQLKELVEDTLLPDRFQKWNDEKNAAV